SEFYENKMQGITSGRYRLQAVGIKDTIRLGVAPLVAKPPIDTFQYSWHAMFNPWCRRFPFQEMVKKLQLPSLDIFSVLTLYEVMCLAVIVQEPNGFLQSAKCRKHFDTLIPRHCPIFIVVHDNHRRRNAGQVEQRGIFDV